MNILLTTNLANAIIEMDNIANDEGLLCDNFIEWDDLLIKAEQIAGRKSDSHEE